MWNDWSVGRRELLPSCEKREEGDVGPAEGRFGKEFH